MTAVFLSVIAGALAISLFHSASKKMALKAWKPLIVSLVLFAVEEILGTLQVFGVYSTPHLTHVVPSFILVFLIASLLAQININKGCYD